MFRRILLLGAVGLAMIACTGKEPGGNPSSEIDSMKEKTALGLYVGGNDTFVYDKTMHQYAFNSKRHTFRIQNSAQNRLVSCTLSGAPSVGGVVEVSITAKGVTNFSDVSLKMSVIKSEGDRLWLYDSESGTGLVIIQ